MICVSLFQDFMTGQWWVSVYSQIRWFVNNGWSTIFRHDDWSVIGVHRSSIRWLTNDKWPSIPIHKDWTIVGVSLLLNMMVGLWWVSTYYYTWQLVNGECQSIPADTSIGQWWGQSILRHDWSVSGVYLFLTWWLVSDMCPSVTRLDGWSIVNAHLFLDIMIGQW